MTSEVQTYYYHVNGLTKWGLVRYGCEPQRFWFFRDGQKGKRSLSCESVINFGDNNVVIVTSAPAKIEGLVQLEDSHEVRQVQER